MSKGLGLVTNLLRDYQRGDHEALSKIMPLVYAELLQIARRQMRSMNPNGTLCPPVLVHELFIRLKTRKFLEAKDRGTFLIAAAHCMRNVLIDCVRQKRAARRGGDVLRVTLNERIHSKPAEEVEIEALCLALDDLNDRNPELRQIVELRYLLGLSVEEVGGVLELSPRTVKRRWTLAKAWLQRELSHK